METCINNKSYEVLKNWSRVGGEKIGSSQDGQERLRKRLSRELTNKGLTRRRGEEPCSKYRKLQIAGMKERKASVAGQRVRIY